MYMSLSQYYSKQATKIPRYFAHAGDAVVVGVNVYVVVAVLFKAGDQLPAMLFVDVVGSGLNVPPEQIA